MSWSRREILKGLALAGAAGALRPAPAGAEPPLETTTVRLFKFPGICLAPVYVAEELLRAEGFTEVKYLTFPEGAQGIADRLAAGDLDLTQWYVAPFLEVIDKGGGVTIVGGVHAGCQQLVGAARIRTIRDLKGAVIAAPFGGPQAHYIVPMLASVGIDHRKDVRFVSHPPAESVRLLAEGKIDAFLALPPVSQELRARNIGRVVVDMATDRPWSQYFCCGVIAHGEFVRRHPVATKRALRAILKADQICALEPERVARGIVQRGFTTSYEYALQTMREVPYGRWRDYDIEDTVRFYALRLREAGILRGTPQKIIADGTDWRFLNQLRKELKG
jgi:NitT/TauT family transport system substrate-binding protein